MNWAQLWIDLFGTTEWMGLNMGFWVSTAVVAVIVVAMNVFFWNVRVPDGERSHRRRRDVRKLIG